ncbi:hypothetical protein M8818_000093 [Zalaria obscura]|uniref:Uncharacterized protein n=1 Tax=Zalaria obscura TaxID=2024903 RepID=A0ACC3SNL6_9PEZI
MVITKISPPTYLHRNSQPGWRTIPYRSLTRPDPPFGTLRTQKQASIAPITRGSSSFRANSVHMGRREENIGWDQKAYLLGERTLAMHKRSVPPTMSVRMETGCQRTEAKCKLSYFLLWTISIEVVAPSLSDERQITWSIESMDYAIHMATSLLNPVHRMPHGAEESAAAHIPIITGRFKTAESSA